MQLNSETFGIGHVGANVYEIPADWSHRSVTSGRQQSWPCFKLRAVAGGSTCFSPLCSQRAELAVTNGQLEALAVCRGQPKTLINGLLPRTVRSVQLAVVPFLCCCWIVCPPNWQIAWTLFIKKLFIVAELIDNCYIVNNPVCHPKKRQQIFVWFRIFKMQIVQKLEYFRFSPVTASHLQTCSTTGPQ